MRRVWQRSVLCGLLMVLALGATAQALDDEHARQADQAITKGIAFLRTTQAPDGSWTKEPGPAITAMVMGAMLDRPDISADDPTVAKALAFVLSKAKEDGSIHDGILEVYNTSICLSALAKINNQPRVAEVIKKAQDFLKKAQFVDGVDAAGKKIDENHPYYGGFGYGNYSKHGRPDMSNLQIALEGLYDSGVPCSDPVFQRAILFVSRCQGIASNKMFGDKIVNDGGAIYATSINKDKVGEAQSAAGEVKDRDGKTVLRTYGSMTYAMLKSYVYADLSRDDERVHAAFRWIRNNYTVEGNPGMPEERKLEGYFYYFMTFSRALKAWGQTTITTAEGKQVDWANDLIAKLAALQEKDGSWANAVKDRWMENDKNLASAYALIAMNHAVGRVR